MVRVWSTKDGQLLHEMRVVLRREQREAGGGDDKAAHDVGSGRFAQSVRAWSRVAAGRNAPCVEHEGRAAAA